MNPFAMPRRFPTPSLALLAFLALAATARAAPGLDFDLTEKAASQDALAAAAQDAPVTVTLGGYLESRTQLGTSRGALYSARQRLHPELSASLSRLSLFANANLDYDPAIGAWADVAHPELDECRLLLDTEYLDVSVGNMIVRWGAGDGINPMDLFNPVDQRDPVASARSTKKRAVPMVRAVAQTPWLTLESVFLPFAAVNGPDAAESPWESLALKSIRRAVGAGKAVFDDDTKPVGVEGGLRAAVTARGWDLALLSFQGFANEPVYAAIPLDDITLYQARYPHFRAFGFNFAKGLSAGTLRGELVFKPDTVFPGVQTAAANGNGLARTDFLEGVVGMDWTFFSDLYVNAQYYFEALPRGENGAAYRAFSDGMTFKVSDKFLGNALEAAIQGMVSFSGDGLSVEAYGQYELDDHWKLTCGVQLWEGPPRSRLGQYDANDMTYLKLRYAF
ncbi:hypothetical protein [Solidesulfovibrio alcoholivorans]|uniref:hypothetical protein n=1 Tax=Solidesulfovibrio alcoholivorans TaxID=81406 RepID=UPI000495C6E3|nr:hypothetical protein [Solidesulfovibrio alcoholivorans]